MTIWQRLCCSLAQLLAYVVLVAAHAAWRSALAFSWVRTGLRKRVLALAAPQEDQPCELSFRPGGFTLGQFSLRISSSSGNSSSGPVRLQEVSVAQLSVEWPSLRQNLKLHVHGLSVKLQQLQAPPHCTRPAVPPESNQLQLLEQLLWTGRRKPAKRHSYVHRAIMTYLLQRVSLEVTSSTVLYVQQGEPGPWKPAGPTDAMDGLQLTVRATCLAPANTTPGDPRRGSGQLASSVQTVSELSITGLGVHLLHRGSRSAAELQQSNSQQQPGIRTISKYALIRQRRRARRVGVAVPLHGQVSSDAGSSTGGGRPEWDEDCCLIQQWSATVQLLAPAGQSQCVEMQVQPPSCPAVSLHVAMPGAAAVGAPDVSLPAEPPSSSAGQPQQQGTQLCQYLVAVNLKNLSLEFTPQAAAIANRMLNRYSSFQRFGPYWRTRPQQAVRSCPAAWWQHSGNAVLAECRKRLVVQNTSLALQQRRQYIQAYRAVHVRDVGFVNTKRQYKRVDRMQAAAELRQLEGRMTLCEVATYRIFVAVLHNQYLLDRPHLRQEWLEVLDTLGSFNDMIPRERYTAKQQQGHVSAVGLQLRCPGLGLQLVSVDRDQRVTAQLQGICCACPDILAASASATCSADHVLVHNQKQLLSDQPQTFPVLVMPASAADCAAYTSSFNFRQQRAAQEGSKAATEAHLQQPWGFGGSSPHQQPMPRSNVPGSGVMQPAEAGAAEQQHQAAGMQTSCSSGLDPEMVRIYRRSLVCLYLMNVKVDIAPVKLTLDPGLVTQLLDYVQQVREVLSTTLPSAHNPLQKARPLQQEVMETYRRSSMHLAYSLSSFLPVVSINCSELVVAVPMRNSSQLHCRQLQPEPGSKHELVLVVEDVHLGVRYENSCFSSLVQHVEATGDVEVRFQQSFRSASAASAASGPYAAMWLHPDDTKHLEQLAAACRSSSGGDGEDELGRNSGTGTAPAMSRWGPLSLLPPQLPFVPVIRTPRLWAQMSTQIPSGPAVPGTERRHASATTGGLLAWLSPWQVDLLMGGIDQVLRDALLLRDRVVQDLLKPAVGPLGTPMHGTLEGAAAAAAGPAASAPPLVSNSTVPVSEEASVPSMSILLDVPYLEVLCFADASPQAQAANIKGSSPLLQPPWLTGFPRRERAASKFLSWASQIAPVGSLLVCGSRAAFASCPSGSSAAKVRLGSVLVCNLQLRGLTGEQLVLPDVRQQCRASTTASGDSLIPAGSPCSGSAASVSPDVAAAAAAAAAAGATAVSVSDLQAHGVWEVDVNCFAVSGLTSRAVAGYLFGQQRRHLLLALPASGTAPHPHQEPCGGGMPGVSSSKQLWRLPLDMRLRLRAADYALYLLSLQPQSLSISSSSRTSHVQEYSQLYRGALAAEATRFIAPTAGGKHAGGAAAGRWLAKKQRRSSWQLGSPARIALHGSPSGVSTPGMSPRAGSSASRALFGRPIRHMGIGSQTNTRSSSVDGSCLARLGSGPMPLPMPAVHGLGDEGPAVRRIGSSKGTGMSPQQLQATLSQLNASGQVQPRGSGTVPAEQQAEEGGLMGIGLMRMVKGLRTASQMRLQTRSRAAAAGHHSSGPASSHTSPAAYHGVSGTFPEDQPVASSSRGSWTGWLLGSSRQQPTTGSSGQGPDEGGRRSSAGGAGQDSQPHPLDAGEEEDMPAEQLCGPALWLDYADHFMSAAPGPQALNLSRSRSPSGSWCPYRNPQIQVSQQWTPGGGQQDGHSSAGQQQPGESRLEVTVAQLKVLLGPHTVGMLLQMASSVQQVLRSRDNQAFIPTTVGSPSAAHASSSRPAAADPEAAAPGGGVPCASQQQGSATARVVQGGSSSSSSSSGRAAGAVAPQQATSTFNITMHSLQVKLMMDKATGTAQAPSAECQPVARLLLLGTAASFGPAGGAPSAGMPQGMQAAGGRAITCRIGHIALQDLQAAVEHKHVLSFNAPKGLTPWQQRGPAPNSCTLQLACLVPAAAAQEAGQPTQVLLKLSNPRLIVLRRFVNNVAFVAEQFKRRMSVLESDTAGRAAGKPVPQAAEPAAAGTQKPATGVCVTVRVTDMQLILPSSHVCKTAGNHYSVVPDHCDPKKQERQQQQQQDDDDDEVPSAPHSSSRALLSPLSTLSSSSTLPAAWADAPATSRPLLTGSLRAGNSSGGGLPASDTRSSSGSGAKQKYAWYPDALVGNVGVLVVSLQGQTDWMPSTHRFLRKQRCSIPDWLTNPADAGELVASSKAILAAHSQQQGHQQDHPQRDAAKPGAQSHNQAPSAAQQPPSSNLDVPVGAVHATGAAAHGRLGTGRTGDSRQPTGTVVFRPGHDEVRHADGITRSTLRGRAAEAGLVQFAATQQQAAPLSHQPEQQQTLLEGHGQAVQGRASRAGQAIRRLLRLPPPAEAHTAPAAVVATPPQPAADVAAASRKAAHAGEASHTGQHRTMCDVDHEPPGPVKPAAQLLLSLECFEVLSATILRGNSQPNPKSRLWQEDGSLAAGAAGPFTWSTLQELQHILHPVTVQAALHTMPAGPVAAATDSGAGSAGATAGSDGTPPPVGATVLHLDLSSSMQAALSPSSYTRLMAICTNNLVDWCSTFTPAADKKAKVMEWAERVYNTKFNPNLRWGPAPLDRAAFAITLSVASFEGTLLNNPVWWLPKLESQGWSAKRVLPCAKIVGRPLSFSLQSMRGSGDLYLNITTSDIEVQDIRLLNPLPPGAGDAADATGRSFSRSPSMAAPAGGPPLRQEAGSRACATHGQQEWLASPLPERGAPPGHTSQRSASSPKQSEDLHGESLAFSLEAEQGLANFDVQPHMFSWQECDGVQAPVSVIRSEEELPAAETAHLAQSPTAPSPAAAVSPGMPAAASSSGGRNRSPGPVEATPDRRASHGDSFRVSFAYLADGTMVVEVQLSGVLVQWPYLTDMTLVSSIVSVFVSWWGGPPWRLDQLLQLKKYSYLYFNLLINDSQVYLPFMSPSIDKQKLEQETVLPSIFLELQRVLQQQVAACGTGSGATLQALGLATTFGAFRLGYFSGGDGDCRLLMDLRNAASFFRDPRAVVTNWLLPLKALEFELRWDMPKVEQHKQFRPILLVLRRMLLQHRLRKRRRAALRASQGFRAQSTEGTAEPIQGDEHDGGSSHTHSSTLGSRHQEPPELRLLQMAEANAKQLLKDQGMDPAAVFASSSSSSNSSGAAPASSATAVLGAFTTSQPWLTAMRLRVEPVTVRAAFSNIPAWNLLMEEGRLLGLVSSKGLGLFGPNPTMLPVALRAKQEGCPWPPPLQGWAAEFRRRMTRTDAQLAGVSVVLCDDKPTCFGAPDVLQVSLCGLGITYGQDCRLVDVPAEYAARMDLRGLSVDFLNNSSSRWERLVDPWPLAVAVSDPINPMFKSSRTRYIQLLSNEPLYVNFHPACLLTLGDALAFQKALSAPQPPLQPVDVVPTTSTVHLLSQPEERSAMEAALQLSAPTSHAPDAAASCLVRGESGLLQLQASVAPTMQEQMALGGAVTDRVPQRYLINNQTGLNLWYWASPNPDHQATARKAFLAAHKSEELRVAPVMRSMQRVAADGMVLSRGSITAISVQLEGRWLPLEEVAVDVVGKYRYEAKDPQGRDPLVIVVDVLLVGRTKMLKLHSALWVQNNTGIKMSMQLQLPDSVGGVPVVLAPGDRLDEQQVIHMRSLKPKEGRFLPAPAALGGQLWVQPQGYSVTKHDVLQLRNRVADMREQQGFIRCDPLPKALTRVPLHLCASVHLGLQTDPFSTTQNHVEVPHTGQQCRARFPLEAAIRINPVLQITNALPYTLTCYVVTSGLPTTAGGAADADQPPSTMVHAPADAPAVAAAAAPAAQTPAVKAQGRRGTAPAATPASGSFSNAAAAPPVPVMSPSSAMPRLSGKGGEHDQHWNASRQPSLLSRGAPGWPLSPGMNYINSPAPSQRRGSLLGRLRAHGPASGQHAQSGRYDIPAADGEQALLLQALVQHAKLRGALHEQLLEEFLLTLQVLSSSALALVDPDVLGLLDLEQTQAFIVGLLKEQLKAVSKGLVRDFEILQKLESDSLLKSPQELLAVLQWVQQHVTAVELLPGMAGDLFFDPSALAHAAVHVPALRLSSKPTLISAGSGRVVSHAELPDSIKLVYVPEDCKPTSDADKPDSCTPTLPAASVLGSSLEAPPLHFGKSGLLSLASGTKAATDGLQGVLVPLSQLHPEVLARETAKAQELARLAQLYNLVQQHEAMRSSEPGGFAPSAASASSGTWDAVVVLCNLAADMVRLAAYDSRMHAVLLEAVATCDGGQQGLTAAHLAAVPQHLPPADLLQQAEDVAYHLQQQCSSEDSGGSSLVTETPWRMAAEELATVLAHPGPHIYKVLEKLQNTSELLTDGELRALLEYMCSHLCSSSWAQQLAATSGRRSGSTTPGTSRARRSKRSILGTATPAGSGPAAGGFFQALAPGAAGRQPDSSASSPFALNGASANVSCISGEASRAAGQQPAAVAASPVMWTNQAYQEAAVAVGAGNIAAGPVTVATTPADGAVDAAASTAGSDGDASAEEDAADAPQVKRAVSWRLPGAGPPPLHPASASLGATAASPGPPTPAPASTTTRSGGGSSSSSVEEVPAAAAGLQEIQPAEAGVEDQPVLAGTSRSRGMKSRPRPARLHVAPSKVLGSIQPIRKQAHASVQQQQQQGSGMSDGAHTSTSSSEDDGEGTRVSGSAGGAAAEEGRHLKDRLVESLRHATLKRLASQMMTQAASGAAQVAQVQSQLVLRMLRKRYPNTPGLITTMPEPHTPAGGTALENQRGGPGWCAPSALILGLSNTSAGRSSSSRSVTVRLTLHAKYWLDNRSGLDLLVKDLDAHLMHASSLLPGGLPCTSVYAPGLGSDATAKELGAFDDDVAAAADSTDMPAVSTQPALLNEQTYLSLHVLERSAELELQECQAPLPPQYPQSRRTSITELQLLATPAVSQGGALAPGPTGADKQQAAKEFLRSHLSASFRISVTGSKSDLAVRGAEGAMYQPTQGHHRMHQQLQQQQGLGLSPVASDELMGGPQQQVLRQASGASAVNSGATGPMVAGQQTLRQLQAAGRADALLNQPCVPLKGAAVQRLYELAVEVWPGPADGPFRATKVVSIKSKYLLLNDTGMPIEFKQKDTPDLDNPSVLVYGHGKRFAGCLEPSQRCVLHWDNVNRDRQLVVRPRGSRGQDWQWSGSFAIPDKEQYFGLRIHNRSRSGTMILPVNTTVGRSGTVLITLKSRHSIPPYRIDNRCKNVSLRLRQKPSRSSDSHTWDLVAPSSSMAFAWDQPQGIHEVEVAGGLGSSMEVLQPFWMQKPAEFRFEEQPKQEVLYITSQVRGAGGVSSSRHAPSQSAEAMAGSSSMPAASSAPLPDTASGATTAHAVAPLRPTRSGGSSNGASSTSKLAMRQTTSKRLGGLPGSSVMGLGAEQQQQQQQQQQQSGPAGRQAPSSVATKRTTSGMPPHGPRLSGTAIIAGGLPASSSSGLNHTRLQPQFLAKRVYVKVYADGPTQVLAFSDDPMVGSPEEGEGLQQLVRRLQQVSRHLRLLEKERLAQLGGVPRDSRYALRTAGLAQQPQLPHVPSYKGLSAAGRAGEGWARPAALPASDHSRSAAGTMEAAAARASSSQLSAAGAAASVPAPGASLQTSTVERRVELEKVMAILESDLPIGGDLKVKVNRARGLAMTPSHASLYVKVSVQEVRASRPRAVTSTAVPASSNSPEWSWADSWTEVSVLEDLLVEVYSAGHAMRLAGQGLMYDHQVFLGQAVVPLLHTLPEYPGAPGSQPRWYQLTRQKGAQQVAGEVELAFEWTITREGMLSIAVALLERNVRDKLESTALRQALSAAQVSRVLTHNLQVLPSGTPTASGPQQDQQQVLLAARDRAWAGLEVEADAPAQPAGHADGSSGGATCSVPQVFHGLELSLGSSHLMDLEVQVLEARNLQPRPSWQQKVVKSLLRGSEATELMGSTEAQRRRELPWACVRVECGGRVLQAAAATPSLSPHFKVNRAKFPDASLHYDINIKLYDNRDRDWHLLGEASLPASAIPGTDPVFLWLPLQPPEPGGLPIIKHLQRRRAAANPEVVTGGNQEEPMQVLLRLQISRPGRRPLINSLQLAMAGALLNVKTDSTDELMNWTVDTVRCVVQTSSSQVQLSLLVQNVQLDNQLLETRHPVVLSSGASNQSSYADLRLSPTDTDKMLEDLMRRGQLTSRGAAGGVGGITGSSAAADLVGIGVVGKKAASSSRLRVTGGGSGAGVLQQPQARPMIWLSVCQLLTGAAASPSPQRMAMAAAATSSALAATAMPQSSEQAVADAQVASAAAAAAAGAAVNKAAIVSFRKIELQLGALDFETEQGFLEAVYVWAHTLPLQDLWQDEAWTTRVAVLQGVTAMAPATAGAATVTIPIHANTGRLLTATGRRHLHGRGLQYNSSSLSQDRVAAATAEELAMLAPSTSGPAPIISRSAASGNTQQHRAAAAAAADQMMSWLALQHEKELQLMKGQSSIWYFLEKLYVSALNLNVTIAVSSSIISTTTAATGGRGGSGLQGADAEQADKLGSSSSSSFVSEVQRQLVRRLLSSISGGMDYQLINVSNVGLHLSGVQLDGRLVNQVGLASLLVSHYRWQGIAEARKVLGGTGPGLLAIPASLLWAGISMVDLAREIAVRKRSPLHVPPAVMHLVLVVMAQVVGVCTRYGAAVWGELPLKRRGAMSDAAALQRFVRTPRTAGDAFAQAGLELYLGVCAAVMGLLLDPVAGARLPGAWALLGILGGLVKGVTGVGVRLGLGASDAGSKALRGAGLLFLGWRGIQGKVVRRVRPPGAAAGALDQVQGLGGSTLPGAGLLSQQQEQQEQLRVGWQAYLHQLLPQLAEEEVWDVLATRSLRLVLLTSGHVAYLRARRQGSGMAYSVRWVLACETVDHVRGAEDSLRVVLEYRKALAWKGLRVNVPLHHSLRCANPDVYQRVIKRVSRHLGRAKSSSSAASAAAAAAAAAVAAAPGAAAGPGAGSSSLSATPGHTDLALMPL